MGLSLDEDRQEKLLAFLGLLNKWNRAYNLTAVRDERVMVSRQLLDSLSILPWVTTDHLLDVGAGGGLPGIPLAIALPEKRFTLLDSNGNRFSLGTPFDLRSDYYTPLRPRTLRIGIDFAF